jgi:cephalosporin hydroxylase
MPLLRTYDAGRGAVTVTLHSAYLDRLARWSDIQDHMPFLREQARSRPGCQVLELGCRKGNSTLAFLDGVLESGGHVHSCDAEDVLRFPDGIGPWGAVPQWAFTCGDDMDVTVQSLLPARCDVLFIDTSHTHEHTLAELRAFVPRVSRRGGIVLCHDTNLSGWPGYDWAGPVPPVRQALDEYCAETGLTWVNMPGVCGMGVIRL